MPSSTAYPPPRPFRSLSISLTLAFFAVSASVLVILGGLSIFFAFGSEHRFVAVQQQLVAQGAVEKVSTFISDQTSVLETAVAVGDLEDASLEERQTILDRLANDEAAFRYVVLLGAEGETFAESTRLSSRATLQIPESVRLDTIAETRLGKSYLGPVYLNEETGEPLMVVAAPMTDAFGDYRGALAAEVNLKFLWDLVDRIKVGDSGSAYVVDKDGNLIAHGDITRVLERQNLAGLEVIGRFMRQGGNGETIISKGIDGTSVATSYASVDAPGWAVVTELPITEAYAPVIRLVLQILIAIFLSFGFAYVASLYVSRSITKPIIALRDASIGIMSGESAGRIAIQTNDEIGQLAGALNMMTAEMESVNKGLEATVKKRTAELDQKLDELQKLNKAMVGREIKMIELKREIDRLTAERK